MNAATPPIYLSFFDHYEGTLPSDLRWAAHLYSYPAVPEIAWAGQILSIWFKFVGNITHVMSKNLNIEEGELQKRHRISMSDFLLENSYNIGLASRYFGGNAASLQAASQLILLPYHSDDWPVQRWARLAFCSALLSQHISDPRGWRDKNRITELVNQSDEMARFVSSLPLNQSLPATDQKSITPTSDATMNQQENSMFPELLAALQAFALLPGAGQQLVNAGLSLKLLERTGTEEPLTSLPSGPLGTIIRLQLTKLERITNEMTDKASNPAYDAAVRADAEKRFKAEMCQLLQASASFKDSIKDYDTLLQFSCSS